MTPANSQPGDAPSHTPSKSVAQHSESLYAAAGADYRALFDSLDQAFLLAEVLFDSAGAPVDLLYLDANAAAVQLASTAIVGRRATELFPGFEAIWLAAFGRVACTGISERHEFESPRLQSWFNAYLFRVAGPHAPRVAAVYQDITARKRDEVKLREVQDSLHVAVEAAELGNWTLDLTAGIATHRNLQHDCLFGYHSPLQQWSLHTARSHVLPEDRHIVDNAFSTAHTSGRINFEVRVRWPDDTIHWMGVRGRVHFDEKGIPVRAAGVNFDVTERKRAEAVLRAGEIRESFLFHLNDALRPLSDPEAIKLEAARVLGEFLQANRVGYAEVCDDGRTVEIKSNYANGVDDRCGVHDVEDYGAETLARLTSGETLIHNDVTLASDLTPAEKARYQAAQVGASVSAPLLKNGRFIAVLFMHQSAARVWTVEEISLLEAVAARTWDAVERARTQAALQQSQALLHKAFTAETVGVLFFNLRGNIRQTNQAFVRITGYTPEELYALNVKSLIAPGFEELCEHHNQELMTSGVTAPHEKQLLRKDGTRVWGLFAPICIRRAGLDTECVEFAIEISDRKRIEEALRHSEELLRATFDSTSEGLVIKEAVLDANGRIFDYALIDCNAAFTALSGLADPRGHMASEIMPLKQPLWLENYERVLATGEPAQFQAFVGRTGRWFGISASRLGPAGTRRVVIVFSDITERKRSEERLRQSEERQAFLLQLTDSLRRLSTPQEIQAEAARVLCGHLRVAGLLYAATGSSGDVDDFRLVHCNWHGLQPAGAVLEEAFHAFFSQLDLPALTLAVPEVAHEPALPLPLRERFTQARVHALVSVPFRRQNKAVSFLVTHHDSPRTWSPDDIILVEETAQRTFAAIDRAAAETALRESEEHLRALVNASSQVLYLLSADCAEMRQLGRGGMLSDLYGSNPRWVETYIPEEDQPSVHRAIEEALRTKTPFEVEHRVRRTDGNVGWVLSRAVPILNPHGQITQWFGAAADVTQRKQAEQRLRESEQRFRSLVGNLQEYALFQTDLDGFVTSWNAGAERLFGYDSASILGCHGSILLTAEQPLPIFDAAIQKVLEGRRSEIARWSVRKDGTRFWARWVTEPVHDQAGVLQGVVNILRDETEREEAEAALRSSLAEKVELLKEVHHRVKNNLQVISSLLHLQARHMRDGSVLAAFDEARNRVHSIAAIHELIYRSISFAAMNLADYARQLVPELIALYGVSGRILPTISGDQLTLELERAVPYGLLLNELVSNVCKHAFPGESAGTLHVSFVPDHGAILMTVADSGVGLPPAFDYHHAGSLGLRLVHSLARQLRALIQVQSHHGLVVTVRIPKRLEGSVE